jgi:deoxyribodipyrimidine photolyase-like uncharacterized protein
LNIEDLVRLGRPKPSHSELRVYDNIELLPPTMIISGGSSAYQSDEP